MNARGRRCANLKIETWILNVVAVAMWEDATVERMMRSLEFNSNVWPLIEIRVSRKKIGKSRRNTIGLSGNKNDRLLVNSKVQYCSGISKTQTLESIRLKSKGVEDHDFERR